MQLLLPRGFSANLLLLIWGLFGGVLVHGFLANYRCMLLSPVLEEPVDTAEDVLKRGIIPFSNVGVDLFFVDLMKKSPNPVYQQLAEIFVVAKTYDEYRKFVAEDVDGAGTHVMLGSFVRKNSNYHVSKEGLQGIYLWSNWVVNKRWPLNEELAVHLLRFQQVCIITHFKSMTSWVVHFKVLMDF